MEIPANATLLVIDVQDGVNLPGRGQRNNPQAEENIAALLEAWRNAGLPILHVKHNSRLATSPFYPTAPGNAIMEFAQPREGEPLIEKDANNAFVGTDLEERLRQAGSPTLVIVGFHTNHCVETTARMAGDLGFDTYVVADAMAAFDRVGPDGRHYDAETLHGSSLASIHGEFATVVSTSNVLTGLEAYAATHIGEPA